MLPYASKLGAREMNQITAEVSKAGVPRGPGIQEKLPQTAVHTRLAAGREGRAALLALLTPPLFDAMGGMRLPVWFEVPRSTPF